MRVKIKLTDSVRQPRILTGASNLAVCEYRAAGKSLDELLNAVPNAFYDWVKLIKAQLEWKYNQIEAECRAAFRDLGDRNALYYRTQRYPSVLFKKLANTPYGSIIYKHIRPTYPKAFKTDDTP